MRSARKQSIRKRFIKSQDKSIQLGEERLTREEQLKVIQWLVELKSTYEISDLIADEFCKKISPRGVWRYKNSAKWKPIISRLRKRFEDNLVKIPIANKADRLRYLQKIVVEGFKWSVKGRDKFGDDIFELKLGDVANAVKAARDEMEPDKRGLKVEVGININLTKEEAIERSNRLREILRITG